ncbi:MAG TPA: hypothetical protein PLF25_03790 [Accumulibacter sp.]|nr:hypothetical protein [Accumulibacter sp.]
MSSHASAEHAAAIIAAAHELKRRRLAAGVKLAPPELTPPEKRSGKAKKVLLKLRLSKSECRCLNELKRELADCGFKAGKNDIVRASLLLLFNLDRAEIKVALRKIIAPELPESSVLAADSPADKKQAA